MFQFDPDSATFNLVLYDNATREAAAANARLNALRRAFPEHADNDLIAHAIWFGHRAPTPELSIMEYERQFNRLSKNRQRLYLKAVKATKKS